ncbi:MAG: FHA domain-containing protein [Actinobacteria bacterium]|jgi:pSer/pThr/pTyr-binding forkhead associated (FHA) protein|nr:FHA domain-containing protein [Actinomycetota bacterium]
MAYVFCNRCGHRNPPTSGFCSACGSVLDLVDDRTITLTKVDPLQDAPGPDDDIVVDLDEIAAGTAILVVRSGEEEGDYFVLSSAVTTIGRHAESTIVLDDITVSRRHSEIHKTDGRYLVKDAGSLNGTYVNQERVDVAELRQGDELQVGKFHLIFLESADKR